MNRMRSLAKRPRLERHENPNSTKVKKNTPSLFWKPAMSSVTWWKKTPQNTDRHIVSGGFTDD